MAISCSTTRTAMKSPAVKSNSTPEFINTISVTPGTSSIEPVTVNKVAERRKATPGSLTLDNSKSYGVSIEKVNKLIFKYAVMLDMAVENIGAEASLFEFIDDWYGTPYRYGGNTRSGIDCSAFSSALLVNVFGITLPRTSRDQYQFCERVPKGDLKEGDLVFFNIRGRGVSHVGVYLANNKFVHASVNNGVVISDLGEGYYASKFMGGGRVRK